MSAVPSPSGVSTNVARTLVSTAALLALLAWITFIYLTGLNGPFVFDDALVFPTTQLTSITYESVMQTLMSHGSGMFKRPISILSLVFNGQALGFSPSGYKVVNLGLHLINTLLIFALVKKILFVLAHSDRLQFSNHQIIVLSILISATWAIHPLQVSTVLYVFQRHVLLATLFTLIALIAYVSARGQASSNRRTIIYLFIVFPIALVLALLSKENGVLIIPLIVLLEFSLFSGNSRYFTRTKTINCFLLVLIALPCILGMAFLTMHFEGIVSTYASRDFTMMDRLRTQPLALLFYLKLMTLPDLASMSFYHDDFPVLTQYNTTALLSLAGVIILVAAVFIFRTRAPLFSLGIGIFLVAHSLESTFIPLEMIFEHRNYLALLGISLAVSQCFIVIYKLTNVKWSVVVVSMFILASLSGLTYSRNIEWSDNLVLARTAANENPGSMRVQQLYAGTLAYRGFHEESLAHIERLAIQFDQVPSIALQKIALMCLSGMDISQELDQANSFLQTSELRQDVVTRLVTLQKLADRSACSQLTQEKVYQFSIHASDNKALNVPNTFAAQLFHIRASYAMKYANQSDAVFSIEQAISYSNNHPAFLIFRIALALQNQQIENAELFLEKLNIKNEKHFHAYDSTYDILQQQLHRLQSVAASQNISTTSLTD